MDRLDFLPSKEESQRLSSHFRVPVAVSLWIHLGKGGLLNLLKPEVPCWVLSESIREDGPYEPISYLIEAKGLYLFQKGFEINRCTWRDYKTGSSRTLLFLGIFQESLAWVYFWIPTYYGPHLLRPRQRNAFRLRFHSQKL